MARASTTMSASVGYDLMGESKSRSLVHGLGVLDLGEWDCAYICHSSDACSHLYCRDHRRLTTHGIMASHISFRQASTFLVTFHSPHLGHMSTDPTSGVRRVTSRLCSEKYRQRVRRASRSTATKRDSYHRNVFKYDIIN